MRRETLATGVLVALLALTGAGALYDSLRHFPPFGGAMQVLVVLLALGLELLRIDLFRYRNTDKSAVTAGLTATMLVMALYGREMAVVVALLQALATTLVHRSVWYKALFNAGLFTSATYLAGTVYERLGGHTAGWGDSGVLASFASAALYFTFQAACVTLAISLSTQRSFRRIWSDSFGWMFLQQAITGMVGLLLGRFMQTGMTFIGMVLLGSPLLLLRYSYKIFADKTQTYVEEIERANANLASLNEELISTNDELLQTLGSILDARDRYTYGHSAQVATYSVALAEKLGFLPDERDKLRKAALLHDIGKVGIPESILYKAGALTASERKIMQAHAEIGYLITRQIHSLAPVAEMIRQHHEWFGGGGYPRNLKGDQILLGARIISVADALDTLISDRPYRKGKPVEVAFSEIRRCTGTQFDPLVVGALEQLLREKGGLWFRNTALPAAEGALAMEVAAAMESSDAAAT